MLTDLDFASSCTCLRDWLDGRCGPSIPLTRNPLFLPIAMPRPAGDQSPLRSFGAVHAADPAMSAARMLGGGRRRPRDRHPVLDCVDCPWSWEDDGDVATPLQLTTVAQLAALAAKARGQMRATSATLLDKGAPPPPAPVEEERPRVSPRDDGPSLPPVAVRERRILERLFCVDCVGGHCQGDACPLHCQPTFEAARVLSQAEFALWQRKRRGSALLSHQLVAFYIGTANLRVRQVHLHRCLEQACSEELQRRFRGWRARRRWGRMRRAAVNMQRLWRGHAQRQVDRRRQAQLDLGNTLRAAQAQISSFRACEAATTLQRWVSARTMRRRAELLLQVCLVVVVALEHTLL